MWADRVRPYKIDLVIGKRRKQTLAASVNNGQAGGVGDMSKRGDGQKMAYLTVESRMLDNNQKMLSNPETNYQSGERILVSEFSAGGGGYWEGRNKQNQMINGDNNNDKDNDKGGMLSSVAEVRQGEQTNKWWQFMRCNEESPRQDYINEIVRKEKKIVYFRNLLADKQMQFGRERQEKIEKYEYYLGKLKENYDLEVQQIQKMGKLLKELEEEKKADVYRQLRLRINQDGKRGLNYSPKRMSVFSGMTGTLLLSKDSSNSASRRQENFSFGSIAPERKVVSADKSNQCTSFMSPGRACISRRKIVFNQS